MSDIERAIAYWEEFLGEIPSVFGKRYQKDAKKQTDAVKLALQALHEKAERENPKQLQLMLEKARSIHPYKVYGERETYSQYNEGWCDAINYIDSILIPYEPKEEKE